MRESAGGEKINVTGRTTHLVLWLSWCSLVISVMNPGSCLQFLIMCLFKTDKYYTINFISWKIKYICILTYHLCPV